MTSGSRFDATAGRRHLLLETQDFEPGAQSVPSTSFLRIGAVPDPAHVADVATMRGRTPSAGAYIAAAGAGEDLASRVSAFIDDHRDRCDPPSLDDPVEATKAATARENVLEAERELEAARVTLASIEHVLAGVLADPSGWLHSLHERVLTADKRVADLDAQLAALGAAPPAAAALGAQSSASYSPDFTPKAQREAESARLHTRGGWRDHTDGNRIITTRGDKIEVVRGNYRMLVLGRHDRPQDAEGRDVPVGWDVSGGHIVESSVVVAQDTTIAWRRRQNGTWQAIETTTKNDTSVVRSGDSKAQSFGHYRKNTVGSETPSGPWHTPEACSGSGCRINPKIESRVWASEMSTATGSSRRPVSLIRDATWTKRMRSVTDATRWSDETRTKATRASTDVSGVMSDATTVGPMISETRVDHITDITSTGTTVSTTIGDSKDMTFGTVTGVTMGASVDFFAGAQSSYLLGGAADVTVGATGEIVIGLNNSSFMGASVTVTAGFSRSHFAGHTLKVVMLTSMQAAPVVSLKGLFFMVG